MKRILGTAVVAVLAAGAGLVAPAVATAVPSNVVTSAEFNKVAYGNSIDYVRTTFGNQGKVIDREDPPGYGGDYVRVAFPTYYSDGTVEVEFLRRSSGTWYLVAKYADWANRATRTADKATEPEYNKVTQGNSIAYARSTFGTNGTIVESYEAPGTEYDFVVLEWPTASADGWVQALFLKSSSGVWKVDTRAAFWGVAPKQTSDKATEAEFDQVKPGNSIDHARSTFGTAGTVNYSYDGPGTADDAVWLLWPTGTPEGLVEVDFVKSSAGAWKVESRWAHWDRTAEPTEDVATRDEFSSLALGDTLAAARSAFGTAGTVVAYEDDLGTDADVVVVNWYTGPETEDVSIAFKKNTPTEWSIVSIDDMWGPWSGLALRSATPSEAGESPVPVGPSQTKAPVRPSWDLRDVG